MILNLLENLTDYVVIGNNMFKDGVFILQAFRFYPEGFEVIVSSGEKIVIPNTNLNFAALEYLFIRYDRSAMRIYEAGNQLEFYTDIRKTLDGDYLIHEIGCENPMRFKTASDYILSRRVREIINHSQSNFKVI